MISELAYADVLGLPVIVWGGIATLLMLCFTAAIGALNRRGIHAIPMKYHMPAALATVTLALIHGAVGLASTIGL